MKDFTDLIRALTGLTWPIIAGLLVWRLFPTLKDIIRSRGFTVKVGQTELTVQEMSEQVLRTTAEIQSSLADVAAGRAPEATPEPRTLRAILWVDDHPENNTYEAEQLRSLGVTVKTAKSTAEAEHAINATFDPFDAVISDMGRDESGSNNANAGLDLIRKIRNQGHGVPIFIYASTRQADRVSEITAAGGNGATNSVSQLFRLLRGVGEFPRDAA
ncbi:response regulator [Streptomyces sp. NPDC057900]|uniref:response regulator n=1 Tax=Streptomyces sp. NPDC057900 TaxID=3346274 RepID=UPI0036ED7C63